MRYEGMCTRRDLLISIHIAPIEVYKAPSKCVDNNNCKLNLARFIH